MALNKAIVMGRLIKDPVVRTTGTGTPVASFCVAVNRAYKNDEGKYESDLINCVSWNKAAEFVEKYFHKGDSIIVEGHLQTHSWTDKDGNNRNSLEIITENINFAGSKSDSGSNNNGGNYYNNNSSGNNNRYGGNYGNDYQNNGFEDAMTSDSNLPF